MFFLFASALDFLHSRVPLSFLSHLSLVLFMTFSSTSATAAHKAYAFGSSGTSMVGQPTAERGALPLACTPLPAPPCLHPPACTPLPASPFTVLIIFFHQRLGAASIGAPSFFVAVREPLPMGREKMQFSKCLRLN